MVRRELCEESIRLGRLLVKMMPEEDEAAGLLGLMLLHDSRRAARVDAAGEMVLLADQDRSRWDQAQIAEGVALTQRALGPGRPSSARPPGPYTLQATIAFMPTARRPEDTRWARIRHVYDWLLAVQRSPVVELNRGVAIAMAEGPEAGLSRPSTGSRGSTTTSICTRRARTCCGVSSATTRRSPRTVGRSMPRPTRSSSRSPGAAEEAAATSRTTCRSRRA